MSDWPLSDSARYGVLGTVSSSSTMMGIPLGTIRYTKGTWTALIGSSPSDADMITIDVNQDSVSGGGLNGYLFDIAKGPLGSETVVANNINLIQGGGFRSTQAHVRFPISVNQGERISIRGAYDKQVVSATDRVLASLYLEQSGMNIPRQTGAKITTYGVDESLTKGTTITAGTTNKKGSYAQITPSTTSQMSMMWFTILYNNGNSANAGLRGLVDFAVGAAGQEKNFIYDFPITSDSIIWEPYWIGPLPVNIPQGTRISSRWQSNQSSAAIDTIIYGIA